MTASFSFEVLSPELDDPNQRTAARAGRLVVNGKTVETPVFMPVGTLATVKALSIDDLESLEAQCILGNTYHLHLRPGEQVVKNLGGLHSFMGGWPGAVLTDSGGYQVFSLAHLRSIDETGVTFRAHTDGSTHAFTPEHVVHIQQDLGSDIMMVLDECPQHTMTETNAAASAERTFRWAERSLEAYGGGPGVLFGICQGAMYPSVRKESASSLAALGFPGYAIGGLGVGEPKLLLRRMLDASVSVLPASKPRYLMGIGAPEDLVYGVLAGVDMFDCVLQTREARNGGLLTRKGRLNIHNARFREDPQPIEEQCDCATCSRYSRAYLHHLFRNRELLGYRLATVHNVRWTIRLMMDLRSAIRTGTIRSFADEFLSEYQPPSREGNDGPSHAPPDKSDGAETDNSEERQACS